MSDSPGNPIISQDEAEGGDFERRKVRRRIIAVKKTVLSAISGMGDGEEKQFYLYVNDISEKGMKITTDIFIPEENKIRLKLYLDDPIEVEARTVWAKEIGTGNYMMGIELFADSEQNRKNIAMLLEWASPSMGKKPVSLHRSIQFEGEFNEVKKRFFAHVVTISHEATELTCDFPFPLGQEFLLTFTIREKVSPIAVKGKVTFQKEIGSPGAMECPTKVYKTWIEFLDHAVVSRHLQDAGCRQ